jgi:hypothetical protein
MTENEKLECAIHCMKYQAEIDVCEDCKAYDMDSSACKEIAIAGLKALEEIKMYREGNLSLVPTDCFKRITEELDTYKEIGTVEVVREAVEKTKALKPKKKKIRHCYDYHCAKCGRRFISKDDSGWYCGEFEKFCSDCGTPADWSGEDIESEE